MPLKLLVEPFGQAERVGKEVLLPLVGFFGFEEGGAFNNGLIRDFAQKGMRAFATVSSTEG
jgi:hypothetical protein